MPQFYFKTNFPASGFPGASSPSPTRPAVSPQDGAGLPLQPVTALDPRVRPCPGGGRSRPGLSSPPRSAALGLPEKGCRNDHFISVPALGQPPRCKCSERPGTLQPCRPTPGAARLLPVEHRTQKPVPARGRARGSGSLPHGRRAARTCRPHPPRRTPGEPSSRPGPSGGRTYSDRRAGCAVGRGHASGPRAAAVAPHRPPPAQGPSPRSSPELRRRRSGPPHFRPALRCRRQMPPPAATSPARRLPPPPGSAARPREHAQKPRRAVLPRRWPGREKAAAGRWGAGSRLGG